MQILTVVSVEYVNGKIDTFHYFSDSDYDTICCIAYDLHTQGIKADDIKECVVNNFIETDTLINVLDRYNNTVWNKVI